MSDTATAGTELTSQYAAQVSSDLERNAKEQERISAEIAGLQEQLTALQHDHSVLVNVQQVLGTAPAPVQPAAAPDGAPVPAPRTNASTETGTEAGAGARAGAGVGKRTRAAKKAAGTQGAVTTSKKSVATKPAGKAAAAKAGRPTLVELVRSHLIEQSEPRSAAEVTTVLDTAHPERGIKTTVVRTTLEGLVARGRVQRSKQGSSVYYTAPHASEQTSTHVQNEQQSE
ncbi:BlaI/MecI/CopY family transcriptional regulator [Streptomyces gibsoniae]|uniref:BlaI/MecI/CopY family transcriptional regulator n=1 Tax=Streptomyces gibsoniae TaxID=3075529 RepID=A0ABU2U8R3_9ACTN|nr:BlaI/MecI/CopY family transcriptional regulator [Streptomyces sp. DSM 41699]MDT0469619.1 BlaI/MecI/CopY family transcriptional regulator [Streptomyces sp. DSM 41699]